MGGRADSGGETLIEAPSNATELLRTVFPFSQLDAEARQALATVVEWLHAGAGVRLFSMGDAPNGMYGIVSGRVRFFIEKPEGAVLTADVGPGVAFGEGSLLVGGGRSRTAVVWREALLVRVPNERFRDVLSSSEVAAGIAGLLAARFAELPHPPAHTDHPLAIAVDAGAANADRDWLVEELQPALERADRARIVVGSETQLSQVVGQVDVLLVVRDGRRAPYGLTELRSALADLDPLVAPRCELVLLRDGVIIPGQVARWLAAFAFDDHHHVRRGVLDDARRVGRHVTGTSIGLVLGGGGARGMAHIGVLRALDELAIPVDRVGGSSMGAIIGAQVAMGWPWQAILDENERVWNRRALRFDVALPTVSVSSGRRARRLFDELLGELRLEDFLLGYFCTSTNLSRFELAIHRDGPAAQWIRATASAPGLWPPVVDEHGDLHVDGGQLNNLPTDVMRRRHQGPIIAVDVCATQSAMTVEPGAEPPIGLRHLLRRRSSVRFPSLVETLNRCALLGSLQQQSSAAEEADVYLTPDVSTVGFSGFARIREAVEVGYRTALDELPTVAELAARRAARTS